VVPGTYNVTITSVNGCTMDTTVTVGISTAIMQLQGVSLNVFPNPSSGHVYVEFGQNPADEVNIEVFNTLGQRLLTKHFEANAIQDRILIDVLNAASGTYLIKISSGDEYISKRIVIVKE